MIMRVGRIALAGAIVAIGAVLAGGFVRVAAVPRPSTTTSVPGGPGSADSLTVAAPATDGVVIVGVPPSFDQVGEEAAPIDVDVIQGSAIVRVAVTRRSSPLAVALVLDTSGSMRGEPLKAAKAAALQFLGALPPDAQVSVSSFGATVRRGTAFSTDRLVAVQRIESLSARGETALRDAVLAAVASLEPFEGRRSIVVLSDGADTVSRLDRASALADVSRAGPSIYPIVLASPRAITDAGTEDPAAELSAFATATDGFVVRTTTPTDLKVAFARVAGVVGSPLVFTLQPPLDRSIPFSVLVTRRFTSGSRQWQGSFGDVSGVVVPTDPAFVAPARTTPSVTGPAAVPAPAEVAPVAVASDRGWLYLGIGSFLGLVALVAWFIATVRPRRKLAVEYGVASAPLLTTLSVAVEGVADRLVARHDERGRIRNLLEGTGWSIEPGAFLAAVMLSAAAAALLSLGLVGPLYCLLSLVLVLAVAYLVVRVAADRRRDRFQDQFEGTLQLMSNSLRAGYGVNQAMDTVSREAPSPTSDEFLRALQEARLGQDQIVALRSMAQRVRCADLDWVIDAIEVNREVGGSLTELFASVADTVRARGRLARQVKALSAEGRLSAVVLVVLPFVMMGLLALINPEYIGALTGSGTGRIFMAVAAALMAIGVLWLKKIVKVTL